MRDFISEVRKKFSLVELPNLLRLLHAAITYLIE